jgi:hypothetical protein
VDKLIEAARKRSRSSERDAAAILLAYRHGLRAAELTSLRWSAIDLTHGRMHVNRAKGGAESVHPLRAIAGALPGPSQPAEHGAIHSASTGSICAVLAGLALRDVSPVYRRQPSCAGAGRRSSLPHARLERSTSCPDEYEIGAFLFSALDAGRFSAAGNCKTVASWPSCRNVSRTIRPSGNSRAS